MWSEIIAQNLGLPEKEQKEIKLAARLHDLGKIGIPGQILNKPGKLNKEEYAEVKKHPGLGADLLLNIDGLKEVSRIIRHHQEWYNGKGYPDGLAGEGIPLASRIISVADAYQAMSSDRPYRRAFSKEEVIAELKRYASIQFDPEIVRIFMEILAGDGESYKSSFYIISKRQIIRKDGFLLKLSLNKEQKRLRKNEM